MKKKDFLLLLLLLVPTIVFAKDTCNDNDIKIKSITLKEVNGFSEEVQESTINNNTINLNLKMYDVGDSSIYNISIENTSDENYYFTKDSMKLENEYLEYSLKNDSEEIPAKEEKTIELKISYKNKIPNENYSDINKLMMSLSDKPLDNPKTNTNYYIIIIALIITIPICIKYNKKGLIILSFFGILSNAYALCTVNINIESKIEIENKEAIFLSGQEVNLKMKRLAKNDFLINDANTPDDFINTIKYSESVPSDINKEEKNIVSTIDSPYPIYIWYEDGTIYWWSEDIHPNLNSNSMAFMFNLSHLSNIDSISMWDSSSITNMQSMFYGTNLTNLTALKDWKVYNVDNLIYTFSHMESLTDIRGLSNWDISNVTNLQNTFSFDSALVDLSGLEKWNTSKVENMNLTFAMNTSLISTDAFKNWDTSNVRVFSSMFGLDTSLSDLSGLSNWNVSNGNNYVSMFAGCSGIKNLVGLNNWNVSKGELFINMFYDCLSLEDASAINDWNISSNSNFIGMFRNLSIHPEFSKVPGTWENGTFIPST